MGGPGIGPMGCQVLGTLSGASERGMGCPGRGHTVGPKGQLTCFGMLGVGVGILADRMGLC